MSSSDVTTRKPGSASDWLPCLIYSPSADNLNNFIAKRRAFEENRKLTPQELKPFLVYARPLGFKTSIRNREILSGSDVFVNLPTGYGKPLICMAPLVSGD